MKLIDVEISEGGKKAVFIFFAESRVDFRALVKDLAGLLRMRIEMRQVGSRDEAKMAGCLGPCGLTTCCSTHLRQFQSISISMAKHQGLAPNPAKLTGMCGKLKCCLAYEQAAYDECRKGLLKTGSPVETSSGAGKIIGHNVLKRECIVRLYGGGEMRTPCDKCRKLTPEERDEAVAAARKAREEGEERGGRRGRKDSGKREGKRKREKREKRDGKEGK
jgi:cell fate regulator YaaT (PSP1 superfamily)